MASTEGKNWWDCNLEWSLGGSSAAGLGAGLRTIPSALAGLDKARVAPEAVKAEESTRPPVSKIQSAPPKPPAPPRPVAASPTVPPVKPAAAVAVKAVNFPMVQPIVSAPADPFDFTLEQMLDPNFCGYVRKDS